MAIRGAPQRHLPAAAPRQVQERGQHLGLASGGRDGVRGDDRGAADHAVGEESPGGEQQRLVGAQHERRQRVAAVLLDDGASGAVLVLDVVVAGRRRVSAATRTARTEIATAPATRISIIELQTSPRCGGPLGQAQRVGDRAVQGVGQLVAVTVGQRGDPQGTVGQAPGPDRGADHGQARAVAATERERVAAGGQQHQQGQLHHRLAVMALDQVQGARAARPRMASETAVRVPRHSPGWWRAGRGRPAARGRASGTAAQPEPDRPSRVGWCGSGAAIADRTASTARTATARAADCRTFRKRNRAPIGANLVPAWRRLNALSAQQTPP